MNTVAKLLSVVFVMAAGATSVVAQDLTWGDALGGEKYKLEFALKDLPKEYKAVQISLSGSGGGILENMFGAMAGALGSLNNIAQPKDASQITALLMMIHLTTGEEVSISAQKYLITYKLSLKSDSTLDPSAGPPKSADLEWHLSYVNTASISQLTPLPRLSVPDALQRLDATPPLDPGKEDSSAPAEPALEPSESIARSNAKQLALAMVMYATDNDDLYPGAQSTATVRALIVPYLKTSDPLRTTNPNGGQMLFNVGLAAVSMNGVEDPSGTIVFYDSQPWPSGGRPGAFVDGSARWLTREAWGISKGSLLKTFPRAGALLPADYLVDQDPLRLRKD